MEIVKFETHEAKFEWHIDGTTVKKEFVTYEGHQSEFIHTKRKPRKTYTDKKGTFIKLHTGKLWGGHVVKHYIN